MDSATRLRLIGARAAAEVPDGAVVGLGTGSTADAMVDALGERVRGGLRITGVATSRQTADRAATLGIPLTALDDIDRLDLCIDGADEIDPQLNLVKGRGGALLYEKLVAARADRFIIIASDEKLVSSLGTRLPLPVEVIPFGHVHTLHVIANLGLTPVLRLNDGGGPFVTDGGHFIADCASEGIADPATLAATLKAITGVVEHGLFVGMAALALTIAPNGTITDHAPASR